MSAEITTRAQYLALFDSLSDAMAFEEGVLAIGYELLPDCACAVLSYPISEPSPEYWAFLASQLDPGQLAVRLDPSLDLLAVPDDWDRRYGHGQPCRHCGAAWRFHRASDQCCIGRYPDDGIDRGGRPGQLWRGDWIEGTTYAGKE